MRKQILIGMLAVAVVLVTTAASVGAQAAGPRRGGPGPGRGADGPGVTDAQRPGRGGPGRPGRGLNGPGLAMLRGRMAAALDLTEQQKTAIAAIQAKTREEAAPLLKELREVRRSVVGNRRNGTVNEDAAKTLRTKMAILREQLAEVRTKTRTAVLNELTEEQRAKLQTARAQFENRPGPRRAGPRAFGIGRA